ncbi:manganese/zinc/iron transport system substrate-binding protein [Cyclonatronum proteinivorum]|uniref:Manganese/zinc/iron transport system substrate-binding protein n=1 Tax=Cyclonatronum proteinivorum TaxID=1457365 RepID=A0A345UIA8_9BACT|nr:zinc ABC transporter substrate-binding protein [Cyclonatronum proteinivorum]AXJ00210.1 manganese/zinc/iron transport system substrate-binding protein [Cyclonatronum proteinivorum]
MNSKLLILILIVSLSSALLSCSSDESSGDERPFVVTTTMMLEDTVQQIAGDFVRIEGLMGPGVDPHLYRATPADVRRLERADLIIYNGLFLEARLSEVLARMPERSFAAAQQLDRVRLIEATDFGGTFDPHVWFDVSIWAEVVRLTADRLITLIPEASEEIQANADAYIQELTALHEWVKAEIASIPENRRVLITAHDAFGYFGRAYNIEVRGIQGLSTQSEAGLQDISRMVRFIMDNEIPAIFLESSIAPRSVQSLMNGVRERGGTVSLGGELFSDAMGARNTPEGTYVGMVQHNVNIITGALR